MKCPNCGEELNPKARFCMICGTPVEAARSAAPDTVVLNSAGEKEHQSRSDLVNVILADGVTEIGFRAFADCKNLESITIPDGVTKIGGNAFSRCGNFKSITIPDSVTEIGWSAFASCTSLESITLPDSITKIGDFAFSYCNNLKSINIPESLTEIGEDTFFGCDLLEGLMISDSINVVSGSWDDLNIPEPSSGNEPPAEPSAEIAAPDTTVLNSAGEKEYMGRDDLVNVVIADGVTGIGNNAFFCCSNLKSITIPDSVTEIDGSAFTGCTSLESITLPDSITKIGDFALSDCYNLKSINIPESLTEIGWSAFARCTSLESITLPDSVTKIADFAFNNCKNLKNINIPESLTEIGENTFLGCDLLEGLMIPDSINVVSGGRDTMPPSRDEEHEEPAVSMTANGTAVLKSAGKEEYKGRNDLTNVVIADGVTEIGAGAFADCKNLMSITIPDSVTRIGDSAFRGCGFIRPLSEADDIDNGVSKQEFSEIETIKRFNISIQPYKSKGETKYRYEYSGKTEHKFYSDQAVNPEHCCWYYNDNLFVKMDKALYIHRGGAGQLRCLGEIGERMKLYGCNDDVIATGPEGVIKCSCANSKSVSVIIPDTDETRFLEGVYSDGTLSIGSRDPDKVYTINKNNEPERKKLPILLTHFNGNYKNNYKAFELDLFISESEYSYDHSIGCFKAENGRDKLFVSDKKVYMTEKYISSYLVHRKYTRVQISGDKIPEPIQKHRAYLIDKDLKNGKKGEFGKLDKVYSINNRLYFFGWNDFSSDFYRYGDSPEEIVDYFSGLFTIKDGLPYKYSKEELKNGKFAISACSVLEGVRFDPPELLKEQRFGRLFEKLSLLKRHNLCREGNTDYENASATADDVRYVLSADSSGVIFAARNRDLGENNDRFTAYYWRIGDGELFSCDYGKYDASKGRNNNFEPAAIPQTVKQSSISAPALNGVYRSFGQNTVDSDLSRQGFTVTKRDGADLSAAFKEIEVTTERDGTYYRDAGPLKEMPMAKYTLSLKANGISVTVNKCADMTAYTLDSRYGFIYSKNNKVYRWVGNNETEISLGKFGSSNSETVSLLVLRDHLLITEIYWNCISSDVDHEIGFGGYTSSYYGACPVLYVYSFAQGKVIKKIYGAGVYPGYTVNDNKYVIKVLYYKEDTPSHQAVTNLALNRPDTAFDMIANSIEFNRIKYIYNGR